ncbi:MAG: hypothetical protein MZW92_18105 [Comamonadaceae bacterium]|nr:hypothetical protein [Comamonadaceae bacterium]
MLALLGADGRAASTRDDADAVTLDAGRPRQSGRALRTGEDHARLDPGAGAAAGALPARRGSRCPAAAPSARGRSTSTSRACRRWAPRSASSTATSTRGAARLQGRAHRSSTW